MKIEQLDDYCAKEKDISIKLFDELRHKSKFDIIDFYPELDLTPPYGAYYPTNPLLNVLPYYKKLIVYIPPYPKESLEMMYKLNVNQIMDLWKVDKKIEVVLDLDPITFAGEKFSYLDPILKEKPPVAHRHDYFRRAIMGEERYNAAKVEAYHIFQNNPALTIIKKPGPNSDYSNYERIIDGNVDYWKLIAASYIAIKSLGYDEICDKIFSDATINPYLGGEEIWDFLHLLVLPRMYGINGSYMCDTEHLMRFKYVKPDSLKSFPYDIGQFLTKKLELVKINSIDHSLDVWDNAVDARKALNSLEKEINSRTEVFDRDQKKKELEDIWGSIIDVERKKGNVQTIFTQIGIVGTALSGLLQSYEGILSSLGFALLSNDIASPLPEVIAKIGKTNNIIQVYDFKKKVDKSKLMNN
jgi:hypothetical protein